MVIRLNSAKIRVLFTNSFHMNSYVSFAMCMQISYATCFFHFVKAGETMVNAQLTSSVSPSNDLCNSPAEPAEQVRQTRQLPNTYFWRILLPFIFIKQKQAGNMNKSGWVVNCNE